MNYNITADVERIRKRHLVRKAVREFGSDVFFNKDDAATIVSLKKEYDGGPGSGNFGHAGREGKVGGSAPSDEAQSKTSGAGSVKTIASAMKKMEYGETVEAHDNAYGFDSIFLKREGNDGTWVDTLSGEIVHEKDLLNPKKYSNLRTGKQAHDEHVAETLKPKFKSKEEYLKRKKEVYDSTEDEVEWFETEYKNAVSEIDSKYGNKYELRSAITNDSSLSENERDEKLYELDEKFDRKKQELASIDSEFYEYRESVLSKRMEIFEPEYEFKHISGNHSVGDDCKEEVVNPEGLEENCQRCAVAFELRQRGYDVQASDGENDELSSFRSVKECFDNPECTEEISGNSWDIANNVCKKMNEWGDYSRAIICVSSSELDCGHAFNACKIGNKVYAVDSQSGIKQELNDYMDNLASIDSALAFRTDNVRLTLNSERYVKERGE